MNAVLLIGLVGLWLLVAAVLVQLRRASSPGAKAAATTTIALVDPIGDDVAAAPEPRQGFLERRRSGDAIELWWPGGHRLATVRPVAVKSAGRALRTPWVRRSVGRVVRGAIPTRAGAGLKHYKLVFPPDLLETITTGGSVEVALSTATSAAGRGLPAMGAGLSSTAMSGPAVALAAGAVAMSMAQQQRLDRTLEVIEQRLDLMMDRLRDDDHGRLDAAEALLDNVDGRTAEVPSAQLRTELAAARQTIEAVYFARRRFTERLGDAIGEAQDAQEREGGETKAWAAGVLDAVGEPEQLRSELLVYLRAMVVRAKLATSTAGILAIDGDVADASSLLDSTVRGLRSDFYSIYRRLRPLARWAPTAALPWRRRDWDRAHHAVTEVFELMAAEVEPSLPDEHPEPLELEATVDESGDITDLTIVE